MPAAVPLLAALLLQWAQQLPVKENVKSELLRRDYEAGVRYDEAAVATVSSPCPADDWSAVFDWGEEKGASIPTRRDARMGPCPGGPAATCVAAGGPYALWTDHVYARTGKYPVRIETRVHCFGTSIGTVAYPAGFVATVYGRMPLKSLTLTPSTVPAGDFVALRIVLGGLAPPSNTRVSLRAVGATLAGLPAFVDVPHRASEETVRFQVDGPPREVVIEATTISGFPLRRSVKIRPKK